MFVVLFFLYVNQFEHFHVLSELCKELRKMIDQKNCGVFHWVIHVEAIGFNVFNP